MLWLTSGVNRSKAVQDGLDNQRRRALLLPCRTIYQFRSRGHRRRGALLRYDNVNEMRTTNGSANRATRCGPPFRHSEQIGVLRVGTIIQYGHTEASFSESYAS
jgi:hypothetical protein